MTIDPTIAVEPTVTDCMIANTDELSRCGTAGFPRLVARAKYLEAGSDEYGRVLLRPNFAAVPKSGFVTNATVNLYSGRKARSTGASLNSWR